MASYEAILFDLDGVIIDTHQAVTEFWLRLARQHQVEISPEEFQQYIYGCPVDHTLDHVFLMLNEKERQAVHTTLRDYEIAMTYQAMPGALALLQDLRRQRVPVALVTSAVDWKVETVARQLGLEELFSTQVLASDIRQGKPYPDGYLLAAERLQKKPQQCIVFEDSVAGVTAAVRAGALCVGVRPEETAAALLAAGACCTVPHFGQVRLRSNGAGPLDLELGSGPRFELLPEQK